MAAWPQPYSHNDSPWIPVSETHKQALLDLFR